MSGRVLLRTGSSANLTMRLVQGVLVIHDACFLCNLEEVQVYVIAQEQPRIIKASAAPLLRPQGFPWLVAIGTVLEAVAWNTVLGRRTNLVLVARRVFHSPLLQSPPVLAHSDLSDSRRGRIRV